MYNFRLLRVCHAELEAVMLNAASCYGPPPAHPIRSDLGRRWERGNKGTTPCFLVPLQNQDWNMTSVATGSFNGILYFVLQNMEALFAQRLKSGFMHVCIGKVRSPQESTCIGPQEDGNVFGAVLHNLRSPGSREFFLLLTTDLVKRYGSLTLVLKLECEEKKYLVLSPTFCHCGQIGCRPTLLLCVATKRAKQLLQSRASCTGSVFSGPISKEAIKYWHSQETTMERMLHVIAATPTALQPPHLIRVCLLWPLVL